MKTPYMKAWSRAMEGVETLGIEKCINKEVLDKMDIKQLELLSEILKDV